MWMVLEAPIYPVLSGKTVLGVSKSLTERFSQVLP